MKVKRFLLAALCGMATCVPSQAQKVTYTYDSGGNRILKKIVIISANAKAQGGAFEDGEEENEATAIDGVNAHGDGISISANDDDVTVNVSDADWTGEATVIVHASDGRLVCETHSATQTSRVSLGDQPSGIYILTVKTGRRTKTWRIAVR